MAEENISKDEQIGFHKGCLSTLAKEREEFTRINSIVEQLIQMHMSSLKELGVDVEAMNEQAQPVAKKEDKKPIEDIL